MRDLYNADPSLIDVIYSIHRALKFLISWEAAHLLVNDGTQEHCFYMFVYRATLLQYILHNEDIREWILYTTVLENVFNDDSLISTYKKNRKKLNYEKLLSIIEGAH